MLPCNVLVYENADKTTISIIKPTAAMSMIANARLREIAGDVEEKLKRVFDAVA